MKLNTKLRHICRLHEEMVALMTEVKTETDGAIDFFEDSQGNELQLVRGLKRVAEELKTEIEERKDMSCLTCEGTKIISLFGD